MRRECATVIFFFVEHPDREMLVKKNRNSFSALKLNFCTHKGEFSFARFPDERHYRFFWETVEKSHSHRYSKSTIQFFKIWRWHGNFITQLFGLSPKNHSPMEVFFLVKLYILLSYEIFLQHTSGAFIFLFHFFHIRWLVKTGNGPVAL